MSDDHELVVGVENIDVDPYQYQLIRQKHSEMDSLKILLAGEKVYDGENYKYIIVPADDITGIELDSIVFLSSTELENLTEEIRSNELNLLIDSLLEIIISKGNQNEQ